MKSFNRNYKTGRNGLLWLGGLCCLACVSAQAQSEAGGKTYLDGTVLVNEGQFGQATGSLNYLKPDGTVAYNVFLEVNPGMELGTTSCDAISFADRLFVASKMGNRLVVLNGESLKLEKVVEELKEEVRAVVGVRADLVYVGTMNGIFPLDLTSWNLGEAVPGTVRGGEFASQPGDMVAVDNRVFVVLQGKGLLVIDADKNEVVKLVDEPGAQGVVQAFDGRLWMAAVDRLLCVNPQTLEVTETRNLPEKGQINCQWGAWKPTAFVASSTENVLFWNAGSVWSGGNDFFRLDLEDEAWGEDLSGLKPFFSMEGVPASGEDKKMELYGTMAYDGRSDELVMMTVQSGWGDNFLHNWVLRVDAATGTLKEKGKLQEKYWFPSLPVIPDKMAPFFTPELEEIRLEMGCASNVFDLKGSYGDKDNLECNVRLRLKDAGDAGVAVVTLENDRLTVDAKAPGEMKLTLAVESNGRVTERVIPVTISPASGIRQELAEMEVSYEYGVLRVKGCPEGVLTIYRMDGLPLKRLTLENCEAAEEFYLPAGVYLWSVNGEAGGKLVVR